jgi:hypothetical protein
MMPVGSVVASASSSEAASSSSDARPLDDPS